MMKVLITGVNGFVGSHLADLLLAKPGVEVYGTTRRTSKLDNIMHIESNRFHEIQMELSDAFQVENTVKDVCPDIIFHLAAQAFVPSSFKAPQQTTDSNYVGTLNLLEAVRKVGNNNVVVQISGSSEEYGMVYEHECPIKETNELRPLSPYGVSKVATDRISYQYAKSYGIRTVITRAFNMTGPRRGVDYVDSNWSKQIVEIEKSISNIKIGLDTIFPPASIKHGNLEAIRDFTDVRDTVRAYWLLAQKKPVPGSVFNVCSGNAHTMGEVLDTMIKLSSCSGYITKQLDTERLRPSDVPVLIGDNRKLKSYIDWEPLFSYETSLQGLLDYWRDVLKVYKPAPAVSAMATPPWEKHYGLAVSGRCDYTNLSQERSILSFPEAAQKYYDKIKNEKNPLE